MTTLEIVKTRIKNLDRNVNSYKEIEDSAPALKRQRVNEKMTYILQNPETLKWAVISDEQVEELNNLYNIAKTGLSVDEDPFLFKA
ncbi:MAG: hypothetical protein PHC31_01105 [Clostridia bacterium]|nr:hypothetical protein [Clostridia bacterium]MDD3970492.1 hypothetical protein [Clostridia bacterium]